QLVRPAALAFFILAARPLGGALCQLIYSAAMGQWIFAGLSVSALLDPFWWAITLFGFWLGRKAWRAHREYQRLVPAGEQVVPLPRAIIGRLCLTASALFAVLVAGLTAWGYYRGVNAVATVVAGQGPAAPDQDFLTQENPEADARLQHALALRAKRPQD